MPQRSRWSARWAQPMQQSLRQARPGQAMDMRAAVQAAVAWHPAVRTAQGQLLGADEGVASARAGYYPQVKGGLGAQVNNRDVYPIPRDVSMTPAFRCRRCCTTLARWTVP
jgi:outer membrane protein TolC